MSTAHALVPRIILGLILILVLGGCREFYDEEFEEFNENQRINQTGSGGTTQDVPPASYTVNLASTDSSLSDLSGTARIEVENDNVRVDIDVDGLPANIIQVHYAYLTAECSTFGVPIPNNGGHRRSYTISETSSVRALIDDLRATGASQSNSDTNLEGKRLIVKAFSNVVGTNSGIQLTIACGNVVRSDSDSNDSGTGTSTGTNNPFPGTGFNGTTGNTDLPSPF